MASEMCEVPCLTRRQDFIVLKDSASELLVEGPTRRRSGGSAEEGRDLWFLGCRRNQFSLLDFISVHTA